MGKFLRENWIWILAPIVIVLGLFLVVLVTSNSGDTTSFVYTIW